MTATRKGLNLMKLNLTPLFYRAAGTTLPLLTIALAGCHKHPPEQPHFPQQQFTPYDQQALLEQMAQAQQGINPGENWKTRLLAIFAGAVIGALVGAFFSKRARAFRYWLIGCALLLLCVFGVFFGNDLAAFSCSGLLAGATTYALLSWGEEAGGEGFEPIFGEARPATRNEVIGGGHVIGTNSGARPAGRIHIPLGSIVEPKHLGGSP
jgi:hypothetical protein